MSQTAGLFMIFKMACELCQQIQILKTFWIVLWNPICLYFYQQLQVYQEKGDTYKFQVVFHMSRDTTSTL